MNHHKHEGLYSIDYYAYSSNLRRYNSRLKVLFSFLALAFCIGADNVFISILTSIIMAYLIVVKGGLKFNDYISLLMIPIAFMVLGSIAIACGISTMPLGQYNLNLYLFYIYFSNESILSAVKIMMKAFGAISAMYMMTLSTSTSEIISVIRKAHVPKIIVELMSMIYRFIFIIMDTQCKMKNSAVSRLGYMDFKTACYTFGSIASNLLVVSLKKANIYYNAMESRCYDGDIMFLEEEKNINAAQICGIIVYFMVMISVYIITRNITWI